MDVSSDSSFSPTRMAGTVGAITAALMLLVSMIPGSGLLGQLIFAGGIYYGMKKIRKKSISAVSYAKISFAGIQVAFFASLIMAFVVYITVKFEPSVMDTYLAAAEQMLRSAEISSAEIDRGIQQMRELMSPF